MIEERHGFNKQTLSTFATDLVKQIILTALFGAAVVTAVIKVVAWAGDGFVMYLYLLVLLIQCSLVLLYPTVIAPLFNKFEPLEQGTLKTAIQDLAASLQ